MTAVTLLLALLVATDYSVSDVLVVRTFAEEVYTQFALYGRPEEPAIAALPQWLALGALLWALRATVLVGWGVSGGNDEPRRFRLSSRETARGRFARRLLGLGTGLGLGGVAAAFVAFVAERPGCLARLPEYARIFAPEISTSLLWAAVAAAAATLLGPGLAWTLLRARVAGTFVALWAVTLLACPAPILGIGLIRLLNRPGIPGAVYDSPAILGIAYLVRFLPVAVLLVAPAVRAIPRDLELSARVDGCGSLGVGWRVVVPLCRHSMALSFLVVLALSLGELPCSHLVTPPGYGTVPGRFFSLIHYGLEEDAVALCLLSSLAVALPSVGILLFASRALGFRRPRP